MYSPGGFQYYPGWGNLSFILAYAIGGRSDFVKLPDEYSEIKSTKWGNGFKLAAEYDFFAGGGFIPAAGISYNIDVTKPYGERVEILSMSDGKPFEADRMYRTTINSYLYSGSGSAVLNAIGFSKENMAARLNCSTEADIRFYMMSNLALARETGMVVNTGHVSDWRLVPDNVVSGYLATDTVNFKLIE